MKIHAGAERIGAQHLTWCGIKVAAARAPIKQPVSDITCRRCRRLILASWKQALDLKHGTLGHP